MLIRKQKGFDDFNCIADRCPKSCCIGWQIVIDEESLQKYRYTTGDFAPTLRTGVDHREKCFRQNGGRCAMLQEDGLCNLQKTMGEEYLCDTCRLYPRHEEDFLDLREETLTISCPEVTRMLLDPDYIYGFTEEENEEADDPEEYQDCDPFLLDELAYAREKMAALIQNRSIPFQERLSIIGAAAFDMQYDYDYGDTELIGKTCDRLDEAEQLCNDNPVPVEEIEPLNATGIPLDFSYTLESLSFLSELEVLDEEWKDKVRITREFFSEKGRDSDAWNKAMHPEDPEKQAVFEKLFLSFLYTYLCGSVYDGQIYARCMMAVWSLRWIMLLSVATDLTLEQTVYLYSRQIEHSDENINALVSFFESEIPETA
ncbi:MAG: flagellin lysine-N-methylase [Lachnospiraceae bacterium]|nr:flagellin lysine-N-methylase [Lachnospiraceae bacterium]